MAATGNLLIQVSANVSPAASALLRLENQVKGLAKSPAVGGAGGGLASFGQAVEVAGAKAEAAQGMFGGVGSALQDVGRVAAGVVVGGALFGLTNSLSAQLSGAVTSVSDFANATFKLQSVIGGSTESASQLLAVFDRFGLNFDKTSTSLGIFSKHLVGIEDTTDGLIVGSKSFNTAMRDLGVNFLDAAGKALPMDQVLLNVADKFQSMPDGVDKTALSLQLFGRAGKDLIPTLDLGSAGMQEAEDAATKYGLSLSAGNVDAVRLFGFAHRDLDEAIQGVTVTIGNELMPALTGLAQSAAAGGQALNTSIIPALKQVNPLALGTAIAVVGLVAAAEPLAGVFAAFAASDALAAVSLTLTAASAGEAAGAIGLMGGMVATALGPIGLAILASGALYAAYSTNFLGTRTVVDQVTAGVVADIDTWAQAAERAKVAIDAIHLPDQGGGKSAPLLGIQIPTIPTGAIAQGLGNVLLASNPLTATFFALHQATTLVGYAMGDATPPAQLLTDKMDGLRGSMGGVALAGPGVGNALASIGGLADEYAAKVQSDASATYNMIVAGEKLKASAATSAADAARQAAINAPGESMGINMHQGDPNVLARAYAPIDEIVKKSDAAAAAQEKLAVAATKTGASAAAAFRPFADQITAIDQKIAAIQLPALEKSLARMNARPINPNNPMSELPRLELQKKILQLEQVVGSGPTGGKTVGKGAQVLPGISTTSNTAPVTNHVTVSVQTGPITGPADESRFAAQVASALVAGLGSTSNVASPQLAGVRKPA